MKTKLTLAILILCLTSSIRPKDESSEKESVIKSNKHILSMIDSSGLYINDSNSNSLYYETIVPDVKIKGALILFPSSWEITGDVISNNSTLIKAAKDSGIITIVPSINLNLCIDETTLNFLNLCFKDVLQRYNPPAGKFVIGGFSLGGMNAIRYTEMAYQDPEQTVIKPAAVYGVDPPLDFKNLYYTFKRIIKKNMSHAAVGEASSYLTQLSYKFGDGPDKNPSPYIQHSMYSRDQENGGNAVHLKTTPIRIYSDPDIDWHMKYRRSDYYDMNALDQTAMINLLYMMGNHNAEFINALGKGIRPNGMRHPHSWSIAEPKDCLNWILKCIN